MNDPAARGHAAGKDRLLASLKRMEGTPSRARAHVRVFADPISGMSAPKR